MIDATIHRLEFLLNNIPPLLLAIDEASFSAKPLPHKWSKKEILGHLIDSATNNHHRFVRTQFDDTPTIWYDQDKWNAHGYYQQIDGKQIIEMWTVYNKQILELIKRIPSEMLFRTCKTKDNEYTLEFLINDYVVHLEHHLKQIVEY